MRWITREHVKVDRVACRWVIKKFIDSEAEFYFVPAQQVMACPKLDMNSDWQVLVALAHHADDTSHACWPGISRLVRASQLVESTVYEALSRLITHVDRMPVPRKHHARNVCRGKKHMSPSALAECVGRCQVVQTDCEARPPTVLPSIARENFFLK
jgi:hypothetical protein